MPVHTSRRPPAPEPGAPGRVPPILPHRAGPGGRGPGGAKRRAGRRDPLWARLTLIFGAVLMMTSGVAIVGVKAIIGQATSSIDQGNLLGDAGKTRAEGGKNLAGPIDMLLLGVDARKTWAADDVRSDTIIILHIPATHDQAYLISIPRDTEAHIPPFEKSGYRGGVDKINAAFQAGARNGGGWEGGAQLMAKTIKGMTGIGFDGAAIINFGGFKKIIDALGTVRICVSHEVKSKHMSYVDGKPMWNADAEKLGKPMTQVVHKKGCREMKGWEALDFARQRYGLPNSDYDRQQNQQQLIKAMAKKATEKGMLTNPIKLNQLIKAAGESLILDTHGVSIGDFIFTLKGVTGNDVVALRTNGGTYATNANNRESLNNLSMRMFDAVKEDTLADFVVANPAVLSTRKSA
ncbi:LCP family protein [Micromonospora narathiwatensis]|uniref:Transcriptional attenuator, LytR family n=1 Tax=Micromonospora narathiwatensis TaxID=299146 RepID=A0A1A9AAD1_9ACTN|nr:LCP family protein [Micromonospora narathiwatensis]SBT53058.1 transcriptional attenuator, LytR family [Micromonospora narathiwatensis]